MQKIVKFVAYFVLIAAALVVTGVVDETYLLASIGISILPPDMTANALQQAIEAFNRRDWRIISELSVPLVQVFVLIYIVRTVLLIVATVVLVYWAKPFFNEKFASLDVLGELKDVESIADAIGQRSFLVGALRRRAARKRVESYTFLGAALISLTIAIGFMTREHGYDRPDSLESDATAIADPLSKSESLLYDARESTASRRRDAEQRENEIISLVREQLEVGKNSDLSAIKSGMGKDLLVALAARPAPTEDREFTEAAAVSKSYLDFARKQLDVINHQAEIEVYQSTALAIIIKFSTLILILALSHVLIDLYRRGFRLAVEYEAIADALYLGSADLPLDIDLLRRLFTPDFDREITSSSRNKFIKSIQGFSSHKISNRND